MATNGISLTAALRSNLLSLQNTQSLLDITQLRLATGRKVNSALDSPTSFFASQGLLNRATDLGRQLDGMGQAIQTLKAADEGITGLTTLVEQMLAVANTASTYATGSSVASEVTQYTTLRAQIDSFITDTGYRGTNLLNGNTMTVVFNETGSSTLAVTGVTYSATGLAIAASANCFGAANAKCQTTIDATITTLNTALTTLRNQAATFGQNLSVIQTRQDFTSSLINTLKEGSDKLVLADKNEEGANLLALQTAQQLGVQALALASQANQSVLRLFG